jgi:tetratricopeptide (TPR) repeat protein
MWSSNRNSRSATEYSRTTGQHLWRTLLVCLTLIVISGVAVAQKRRPKPAVNSTAGGDSGEIPRIINNGSPQSDSQEQRDDACLLPPLDQMYSTVIAAAQLRIPAKAKREYERACSALLKKKSFKAEEHLRKAVQEYPKYTAAWVTLGQVLADEHRSEDAKNACSQSATMDPTYLPAYLCLAEIASRAQEWSDELKHSSRALELDPASVLAYKYHAAADANLGNLGEAEKSGLRAIELDKNHRAPGTYFLMAQIYALIGDAAREEEQLGQYLKYTHNPQRAALAKQILAKLNNSQPEVLENPQPNTSPDTSGQSAHRWEPADADEAVPPVDDATCPLSQILQETSQRVTELVESLQSFTAIEQVEHTEFSKNGEPRKSSSELFGYVAEIKESPYQGFWVDEYRTAKGQADPPPLADNGTAALALIFHPKVIGNLAIHCEGRTGLQGTPVWQLRFMEGPDPSKSFSALRVKDSEYRVRLKGRAWISAENYQVLRLQTDLAAALPEINLQVEHLDVAYAPVEFSKRQFRLWLPERASMHIHYRGRRYQRVHSFSHFQLFLVNTEQRVKEPVPSTPKSGLTENRNPIPLP